MGFNRLNIEKNKKKIKAFIFFSKKKEIAFGKRNEMREEEEQQQRSLPILRSELDQSIEERYAEEIEEFYDRANQVCVAGGGLVDGPSSRACAAALLILSQQSVYSQGMGCVVVHNKEEIEVLNDVKKRLFPKDNTMQMMIVEFGELERDFEEAAPMFAKTLREDLKMVHGRGGVLFRLKRKMKEAMDAVAGGRERLFTSYLPYPQTLEPILFQQEPNETTKFQLYGHRFSYLLVFGIPENESQVHAINSICAETRWVSPFSLPVDMEKDQIEEDRKLATSRLPFLVSLSSNRTWTQDFSRFFPWPVADDDGEEILLSVQQESLANAMYNAFVVKIRDTFWKQEERVIKDKKDAKPKSKRNRKRDGALVEDLTGRTNIQHYFFVVSMPKEYHKMEKHLLDQLLKCAKKKGSKAIFTNDQYRYTNETLVSLMDDYLRAEQVQIILKQFSRYDLNRTAIATSSERVYQIFLFCRSIHPGLRVVSFDHTSLRKRSELDTKDANGNPLPPVERVIVTDPFALTERPDRCIFNTFGNNVTFTWVVTRHGVDKLFASNLMAIPYDYSRLYVRDSRVPSEYRPYAIFKRAVEEYDKIPYKPQPYSEGHYFDQESSYRSKPGAIRSALDYEHVTSILPNQIESANQRCIDEGHQQYRIHLPHHRDPDSLEWDALPVCALRRLIEFMEACKKMITLRKNRELIEAVQAYRSAPKSTRRFLPDKNLKIPGVHRPRSLVRENPSSAYEDFRQVVFVHGSYDAEITEEEFMRFCLEQLGLEHFFLECRTSAEDQKPPKMIALDKSLLYFVLQHKFSVLQSTAPSIEKQLALTKQFSENPVNNTLYLLACASLHSLSAPAFNEDSGALCLITLDDGLLGYTDEKHAAETLKTMVTDSRSSQWLAFAPDYSIRLIQHLFKGTRRDVDVYDYCDGWSTITLSTIVYDVEEEKQVTREFVAAENNSEDERALILSVMDVMDLQKRQKVSRSSRNPSSSTSSSSSRPKETSSVKATMVSWRKTKRIGLPVSSFTS